MSSAVRPPPSAFYYRIICYWGDVKSFVIRNTGNLKRSKYDLDFGIPGIGGYGSRYRIDLQSHQGLEWRPKGVPSGKPNQVSMGHWLRTSVLQDPESWRTSLELVTPS